MHIQDQSPCNCACPVLRLILFKVKLNNLSLWASSPRWSVSSSGPTAPSQGGVKQDVGCGGLDWGGGDVRHLMVVKLVPALFKDTLTVGCVMAAVQTPIVVLLKKKRKSSHQNDIFCNAGISDLWRYFFCFKWGKLKTYKTLLFILNCLKSELLNGSLTSYFSLRKLHRGCSFSGCVWVQWHTGPGPDYLMGNPQRSAASASICPHRKTCTRKWKPYFCIWKT